VSSSLVPRLALGGLLVVALWLKVPAAASVHAPDHEDAAQAEIAGFLTRHGFEPDPGSFEEDPARMAGTSGACHVLIANVAPQGWHQDLLRQFAPADTRIFFVFEGREYDRQPVLQTRLSFYWNRMARRLGMAAPAMPLVYGVLASPGCDLASVPWRELGETPAV
jgi:hypothetical protein